MYLNIKKYSNRTFRILKSHFDILFLNAENKANTKNCIFSFCL